MKPIVLGATRVDKLTEIAHLPQAHDWLFTNCTREIIDEQRHWLGAELVSPGGYDLTMSFHSFVIRTPSLTILVDTCNGNHKQRPTLLDWHMLNTPYLEDLAALGLQPEDIDIVMCTHLHADHVGWNTRPVDGRWVPTFPKARYAMSRREYEHYARLHASKPEQPVNRGSFVDSVLPVIEHGQALLLDATDTIDEKLTSEVSLEGAPGHSPFGLNLMLTTGGRSACFCGDVIHHPIQCAVPELSNRADIDPIQAVATRLRILERSADEGTLLMTGHFPDPTTGHVLRHGDAFRFSFNA